MSRHTTDNPFAIAWAGLTIIMMAATVFYGINFIYLLVQNPEITQKLSTSGQLYFRDPAQESEFFTAAFCVVINVVNKILFNCFYVIKITQFGYEIDKV